MITVELRNPPAGGNYWQLVLFNEVWGDNVIAGTGVPVTQPISLASLPAGWTYPLYIHIVIYENLEAPHNVIYEVQSAYGPDWLYYKDITVESDGAYYFDVATEEFGLVGVVQDWFTPLLTMVVLMAMMGMMVPAMTGLFKESR